MIPLWMGTSETRVPRCPYIVTSDPSVAQKMKKSHATDAGESQVCGYTRAR
jgi:hypothetical protein